MKKVINIAGGLYDVYKISAVYIVPTDHIDGTYHTIYEIHIVIDGVDVTVYTSTGIEVEKAFDNIENIIAGNAEIIKI